MIPGGARDRWEEETVAKERDPEDEDNDDRARSWLVTEARRKSLGEREYLK